MQDNTNWAKYEMHVIETLKRLEKSQNELHDFIREHMKSEEIKMDELVTKMHKIENDTKWYSRIFAVASGFVVTCINIWLNKSI